MLRFRSWAAWNSRCIKDAMGKRAARGAKVDAPLYLSRVMVATKFDASFEAFAQAVGGRNAETFFLRVLQYAADHDGASGTVAVPRRQLGATVLSRWYDPVSRKTGEAVYDALLASNICVLSVDMSTDKSADMSRPPSPYPTLYPPSPTGGERSPSAPEPQEPQDDRPLRPRERQRYAKVLDYVIRCGTQLEIAVARRRRADLDIVSDDTMRDLLAGEYRWVSSERIAKLRNGVHVAKNPRSSAGNGPPIDDRHPT